MLGAQIGDQPGFEPTRLRPVQNVGVDAFHSEQHRAQQPNGAGAQDHRVFDLPGETLLNLKGLPHRFFDDGQGLQKNAYGFNRNGNLGEPSLMFAIEFGQKAVLPVDTPLQVIAGHAHIVLAADAGSTVIVPTGTPN